MALITRAMAKRLAANNASSGSAAVATDKGRTILIENDTTVNADEERDDNGSCVSANGRDTGSSEIPMPNISIESESNATRPPHPPHPTVPKAGTTGRGRGTKSTRATKPRRVRQTTRRNGGSSRGGSTPDLSGKSSPDQGDAKYNDGTSDDTSKVTTGRKRGREETSDADLQAGHIVPTRAKTRRIHRDIRRSSPVGEAPLDARKLLNCTNSSPEVMTNDGLNLPDTQYGAERRSDETPSLSGVPGSVVVCSGQFPVEKENAPAERLTVSPLHRSHRKGTCSGREFVSARTMLALSKPRIFAGLQNNSGSGGERNEARFPHEDPFKSLPSVEWNDGATAPSLLDLPVEAAQASTWEAPRLDPDDFAFLLRRATPCRFEESNVRSEAIIRPAQEE
ncbi:hypothetical protein ACEPAI_1862 [Sanghuangporus weigelae]